MMIPIDVTGPAKYLPNFLPDDTIVITDYEEAGEVLRHVKLYSEPLHPTQVPFAADTLVTLNGAEHVFRRRIINRLVRPNALEHYRQEITLPTLARRLHQLRSNPGPDGQFRTDLVTFSKLTFVHFAAVLIGLEAPTEEADLELEEIVEGLHLGEHARILAGDWDHYAEEGMKAMRALEQKYFTPSLSRCPVDHHIDADKDDLSLLSLLANHVDKAWSDHDLALREVVVLFLAAVESTANLVTQTIHELNRWLISHPSDRSVIGDMEFLSKVVQEAVRLYPANPYRARVAIEDVALETTGRPIKKGQTVAAVLALANRDTKVFGPDATEFNPHRHVPPARPRYGLSFGAGQHQCIGLRVVLGNSGVGTHAHVLKELLAAGVRPDPDRSPKMEPSSRGVFSSYPVLFTRLEELFL